MSAVAKTIEPNSRDRNLDYLTDLELQMKEIWAQYVKRLDESGLDEAARSLRDRYFSIYRHYRHNKKWRDIMNN